MSEQARPDRSHLSTDNPQLDVSEIIRIVDDEIDVDAIMAEIRARLAGRTPLDPDPSGLTYTPSAGAESELEWAIEEAAESARDLQIGDQLQPGAGPVGRLATRAKRPLAPSVSTSGSAGPSPISLHSRSIHAAGPPRSVTACSLPIVAWCSSL